MFRIYWIQFNRDKQKVQASVSAAGFDMLVLDPAWCHACGLNNVCSGTCGVRSAYHSTVNMSLYQYSHTVHSNSAESAAAHRKYLYFIQNCPACFCRPGQHRAFKYSFLTSVRIIELASSAQITYSQVHTLPICRSQPMKKLWRRRRDW
jgi:hypothetical protein